MVGAFASASLRVSMASSMSSATFVMDRRVFSRSESAFSATERIDPLSEAAALISGTGFSAATFCGEPMNACLALKLEMQPRRLVQG